MDIHFKLPIARIVHDGHIEMPFWGWPTATIDWCEESTSAQAATKLVKLILTKNGVDYKITPYIAEFVNTVTNAFFSNTLKVLGCE